MVTNKARITESVRNLIDQYGGKTIIDAKWHYVDRGMPRTTPMTPLMIEEFLRVREQYSRHS